MFACETWACMGSLPPPPPGIFLRDKMFWDQTYEMDILLDLHVLRSTESENHIFSSGLCVFVINITRKQNAAETSNLYHICIICKFYLKLFIKTLCTGAHKRILLHYVLSAKFHVCDFEYIDTAINKMKLLYMPCSKTCKLQITV